MYPPKPLDDRGVNDNELPPGKSVRAPNWVVDVLERFEVGNGVFGLAAKEGWMLGLEVLVEQRRYFSEVHLESVLTLREKSFPPPGPLHVPQTYVEPGAMLAIVRTTAFPARCSIPFPYRKDW